jgi:glycosyltransferase involved in cell wall biosynthesis
MMLISVIVTTYNRPDALRAVLDGLAAQRDRSFEVIVADDGSTASTAELLKKLAPAFPMRLLHVWQEDLGFRAGAARNRAVEHASGDYLIFVDGDCVPRPSFVARHRRLSEPDWMVAGNRVLLSESFTQLALAGGIPLHLLAYREWVRARMRGHVNRTLPLLPLPFGPLRKLAASHWQRIRTCNLGLWSSDFQRVGGFDESFEGWGYEDSDLAVRLLNAGVRRKDGGFATGVLHLWHREHDRRHEGRNWQLLQERIASGQIRAERGVRPSTPATDS